MKRSKWKSFDLTDKPHRNKLITPDMVFKTLSINNGHLIRKIKITPDHVNHRLGEFSHSKTTPRFKTKKK